MVNLISMFTLLGAVTLSYILWRIKSTTGPHGSFYRTYGRPILTAIITSGLFQRIIWVINIFKRRKSQQITGIKVPNSSKQSLIQGFAFLSLDDPQSFILAQCLQIFSKHYPEVNIVVKILPLGVQAWDVSKVDPREWILRDAQKFAAAYDMIAPEISVTSDEISVEARKLVTIKLVSASYELDKIIQAMSRVWRKSEGIDDRTESPIPANDATDILNENLKWLNKLGYYGPGVLIVEGEIYQPNRLHHLERRLLEYRSVSAESKGNIANLSMIYNILLNSSKAPVVSVSDKRLRFGDEFAYLSKPVKTVNVCIDLFYSFRSPYSQLAIKKLLDLRDKYGVSIRIRPMIPMVLRGLSVPPDKVKFIALDCAREARLWNIKFGCCCDPIQPNGIPVLRALDAYIIAKRCNKEVEYIASFAESVWGEGIDVGTDIGLKIVTDKAGLPWNEVLRAIGTQKASDEWTKITTENREYLYSRGFWGVPCMEYNGLMVWGQDKLHEIVNTF